MATRRLYGQALGDLADLLLKSHLQQKQADYENDLLTKRQSATQAAEDARAKAAQEATDRRAFAEKLIGNPTALENYTAANPNTTVGGVNLSMFSQTPQQKVGATAKQLLDMHELNAIPTSPEEIAALGGLDISQLPPGAMDNLLAIANKRQADIKAAVPPTLQDVTRANPNGTTTAFKQPMNLWDIPKEGFQVAPTPEQLAANENVVTNATAGPKASAAGKIAGAQAAAQEANTSHGSIEPQFDTEGNPQAPVIIDRVTGKVTPVPASPTQAPPGAAQRAQKATEATAAISSVDRLDNLIDQAKANGLLGPGAGRYYNALAKFGTTQGLPGGGKEVDDLIGQIKAAIVFTKGRVDAGIGGARAAASPFFLRQWEQLAQQSSPEMLHGLTKTMRDSLKDELPHVGGTFNPATGRVE